MLNAEVFNFFNISELIPYFLRSIIQIQNYLHLKAMFKNKQCLNGRNYNMIKAYIDVYPKLYLQIITINVNGF